MFGKIGVRPAMMIQSTSPALASRPPSEDAAQSHAYPAVQRCESGVVTVPEVQIPARQSGTQFLDDLTQRATRFARRQAPDFVFQLVQAFPSRPPRLSL